MELVFHPDELLSKLKSHRGRIYIVAAGEIGKQIGVFLNQNDVNWTGFIDKNIDVITDDLAEIWNYDLSIHATDIFVISSYSKMDVLSAQLKENGVVDKQIVAIANSECSYEFYGKQELQSCRKKMQSWANIHCGERCFIIGNGPSLRYEDLELIKKEYTFGCNSIYALFEKSDWRPTYYVYLDRMGINEKGQDFEWVKNISKECPYSFFPIDSCMHKYKGQFDNFYFFQTDSAKNRNTGRPFFSDQCDKKIYSATTVTYVMIQMAVYMGFKEIYLLGIDFTFSEERYVDGTIVRNGEVVNHFKDIEKEEKNYKNISKVYNTPYYATIDIQKMGYEVANEYARKNGIKIYNATRGGKLEVFDRVDFDTLF